MPSRQPAIELPPHALGARPSWPPRSNLTGAARTAALPGLDAALRLAGRLAGQKLLEAFKNRAGFEVAAEGVLLGLVHLQPAAPGILDQQALDTLHHLGRIAGDLPTHLDRGIEQ